MNSSMLSIGSKCGVDPNELVVIRNDCGFEIGPIQLRGGQYTYLLSNKLLEDGRAHTNQAWESYAKNAFLSNGFIPASGDVLFEIIRQLHFALQPASCNPHYDAAAAALKSISEGFQKASHENTHLGLYSKASYRSGHDSVIHDPGLPISRTIQGKLWGESGKLDSVRDGDEYCRLVFDKMDARLASILFKFYAYRKDLQVNTWPFAMNTTEDHFIAFSMWPWEFRLNMTYQKSDECAMFGVRQVRKNDLEVAAQ